jgi:LPS sulfotransferase NodH
LPASGARAHPVAGMSGERMTGRRRPYDLATAAHDLDSGYDRPLRSVLICTSRRSGSTLLGEALYRAGGLGCPLEYLHAGFRPALAARWGAHDLRAYRLALYRNRIDATGTLGIKLFWPDLLAVCAERFPRDAALYAANLALDPGLCPLVFSGIADVMTELFPQPIHVRLWRRDLLRQSISDHRAARTGRWRSLDMPEDGRLPAIELDELTAGISTFLHQRDLWLRWFEWAGIVPLETTYEQLTADYPGTVRRLAARLGGIDLDAAAAPPRLVRQSDAESERLAARYLTETVGRRVRGSVGSFREAGLTGGTAGGHHAAPE